jgi:hypothetical protein
MGKGSFFFLLYPHVTGDERGITSSIFFFLFGEQTWWREKK